MSIREVTAADAGRVVELLSQLWPEKRMPYEKVAHLTERYVADPSYQIYGYEEQGIVVGIITVSLRWALFYQGQVAIIEDLVVDAAHRGEGIGRKLVRVIEDTVLADDKVKAIEVNSDFHREETHAFWERCGYSRHAFQFRKEG